MKEHISIRIEENLARVENLISLYSRKKGKGRRGAHETDVLRAAVVLLHASLEDFLRSLARWIIPETNEMSVLDRYPFPGDSNLKRPEKVSLGYLIAFKGISIDDVIKQAVNEHLDKSNYNNTNEIAGLLTSIGVEISAVESVFPELSEMMSRRHLIVHRADRVDSMGSGNYKVKSIGIAQLNKWVKSVRAFTSSVLEKL